MTYEKYIERRMEFIKAAMQGLFAGGHNVHEVSEMAVVFADKTLEWAKNHIPPEPDV